MPEWQITLQQSGQVTQYRPYRASTPYESIYMYIYNLNGLRYSQKKVGLSILISVLRD